MTEKFNVQLFKERAFETVAWTKARFQSADEVKKSPDVFRSVVPQPTKPLLFLTPQERNKFIHEVLAERTKKFSMATEAVDLGKEITDYSNGRLLAFFPYLNANDGVVEIESEGYFDYGGYPPWDTWIYYMMEDELNKEASHIITWVSPSFIDIANRGMRFSPDNSLVWLANSDLDFSYIETLSQAGLLV